jgi:plastocyanin
MRALLVVAALLLAAAPAVARARHAPSKPRCAATKRPAAHHERDAGARRPRACARLERGRVHRRAALALARVTFPSAPPAAVAPPAPTPVAPAAPPPEPEPGPTLPPVVSNPRAVQVQGFEYGLQLSKPKVSAGDVKVEFNLTRAEDPHNLVLVRADGSGAPISFDEQPAGAFVTRTVPLTTGTWTLFCSLTGHQALGMRATLKVG